jgi:hypothetical protein
MRLCSCLVVSMLGGCALAGKGGNNTDGKIVVIDGNGGADSKVFLDAGNSGPDAAMAITLSETNNSTIVAAQSVTCSNNTTGNSRDNIWYRAYQLSDYPAISGGLHITAVNFGVQEASSSSPITVKIGSYAGALDGTTINSAQITAIAMGTVTPGNTTTGLTATANVVADIPKNGKFVVQIVAPDMNATGYMYIGATNAGEKHPGYISSASCTGLSSPTKTGTALAGSGQIIIDVVGTH